MRNIGKFSLLLSLIACSGTPYSQDASIETDAAILDSSVSDAEIFSALLTIDDFSQCTVNTPCPLSLSEGWLEVDSSSLYSSIWVNGSQLIFGERIQVLNGVISIWTEFVRTARPAFNEMVRIDRAVLKNHSCDSCSQPDTFEVTHTVTIDTYGVLMFFTDSDGIGSISFSGSPGKYALYSYQNDLSLITGRDAGYFSLAVTGGWFAIEAFPDIPVVVIGSVSLMPE